MKFWAQTPKKISDSISMLRPKHGVLTSYFDPLKNKEKTNIEFYGVSNPPTPTFRKPSIRALCQTLPQITKKECLIFSGETSFWKTDGNFRPKKCGDTQSWVRSLPSSLLGSSQHRSMVNIARSLPGADPTCQPELELFSFQQNKRGGGTHRKKKVEPFFEGLLDTTTG